MTNKSPFCASLRLIRIVFSRLKIKVRPKGLHSFTFYILIFDFSLRPLTPDPWPLTSTKDYVRNYKLFMQNEPKFRKSQMNVTKVLTRDYEKKDTWWSGKTKPIKAN